VTYTYTPTPGTSQPYGPPMTTEAPPTAGSALAVLENGVSALHGCIDRLADKLQPILGPVRAAPNGEPGGPGNPAPQYSPVVLALRAQGFKLDSAILRLDELLNRIEL
jgi:hypothetical protein